MSQAFVKEGDASDDLPERPLSERPNYVTPAGLAALRARVEALEQERAALVRSPAAPESEPRRKLLERDLRYFEARLQSAVLVDQSGRSFDDVRFGAAVEVHEAGGLRRYAIVGEDEAAPEEGKLGWSSPLALALLGSKAGEEVSWSSDEGDRRLSVVSVSYPE